MRGATRRENAVRPDTWTTDPEACSTLPQPGQCARSRCGRSPMLLFALGINHRTAPVHIREKVNFDPARLEDALRELTSLPEVSEGLIVSTCNRTELYCSGSEQGAQHV